MNQELLQDARGKAQQLLDNLVAQQKDLDAFASRQQALVPTDKLATGRQALARAIESTRRTLEQIDQASHTAR